MSDIYDFIRSDWQKQDHVTVIEIGCARMDDTMKMLTVLDQLEKNHQFFAIEPDPRNADSCRENLCFNRTTFIQAAIGNKNTKVTFNQSSGKNPTYGYNHTLSGSVKVPVQHLTAHPWCKFESQVMVHMMRLDDLAKLYAIGKVDFIWCDVQGAEDFVIQGAQEVLARTRYFYTEYYENEMYMGQIGIAEMHRRLPGGTNRWKIVQIWPNDVLFMNTAPTL